MGKLIIFSAPSGSGKSTLLHILGCIDTQTEGSYKLEGKEVQKKNEKEIISNCIGGSNDGNFGSMW